jgi:hypothetical protein
LQSAQGGPALRRGFAQFGGGRSDNTPAVRLQQPAQLLGIPDLEQWKNLVLDSAPLPCGPPSFFSLGDPAEELTQDLILDLAVPDLLKKSPFCGIFSECDQLAMDH